MGGMGRRGRSRAEPESIIQEAFLRAWESLNRRKEVAAFLPWVIRIAVNAARDTLKKSRPLDFADLPSDDVLELADTGVEVGAAADD